MRVVDGHGEARLEALTLEEAGTGRRGEAAAAAVFVLIGAEPRTGWLRDVVRRDERREVSPLSLEPSRKLAHGVSYVVGRR